MTNHQLTGWIAVTVPWFLAALLSIMQLRTHTRFSAQFWRGVWVFVACTSVPSAAILAYTHVSGHQPPMWVRSVKCVLVVTVCGWFVMRSWSCLRRMGTKGN